MVYQVHVCRPEGSHAYLHAPYRCGQARARGDALIQMAPIGHAARLYRP